MPERALRRARRAGRQQRPLVRARPAEGLLVRGMRGTADARGEDRRGGGPRSSLRILGTAVGVPLFPRFLDRLLDLSPGFEEAAAQGQ